MSGSLGGVGTGPGKAELMTPATQAALAVPPTSWATGPYLDRVPARGDQCPPRVGQSSRTRSCPPRAVARRRGPPGRRRVRASIPACSPWRRRSSRPSNRAIRPGAASTIRVEPGVTAMLAAGGRGRRAARRRFLRHLAIGQSEGLDHGRAPSEGRRRSRFVIALYNPPPPGRGRTSSARRSKLLRTVKAAGTAVLFVRAAGTPPRADVITTTLGAADPSRADMRTLVIIGASTTRQVGRWVYTPRSERGAP